MRCGYMFEVKGQADHRIGTHSVRSEPGCSIDVGGPVAPDLEACEYLYDRNIDSNVHVFFPTFNHSAGSAITTDSQTGAKACDESNTERRRRESSVALLQMRIKRGGKREAVVQWLKGRVQMGFW